MSIGLSVQEKKRIIDFQDGCHGGHLGFPIGTILAILIYKSPHMLPNKFQVKWFFDLGEEVRIRFSRSSWISDPNNFGVS